MGGVLSWFSTASSVQCKLCPERGWSTPSLLSALGILTLKRSQWLGHGFLRANFADWRRFTSAVAELLNSYTLPRAAAQPRGWPWIQGKPSSPQPPGTLGHMGPQGRLFHPWRLHHSWHLLVQSRRSDRTISGAKSQRKRHPNNQQKW